MAKVIQELQVGEAVVSTLQAEGTPSFADRVLIYPPKSMLGTVESSALLSVINNSPLMEKYADAVNRESAHEQILAMTEAKEAELIKKAGQAEEEKRAEKEAQEKAKLEEKAQKEVAKAAQRANQPTSRKTDSVMDRFTKNLMSQVGREVGRVVTRGIMGMLKGK